MSRRSARGRGEGAIDGVLRVVGMLLLGARVSRTTVADARRVSLPTADRWLALIRDHVPGVRTFKVNKTRWYEIVPSPDGPDTSIDRPG